MNWNFLFQVINLGIMLLLLGAAIYVIALFIKAAKRVIRVSDVYLEEKARGKQVE